MQWLHWLDIQNTMLTIPLGTGYALSYIEASATLSGLICIWLASKAKITNFIFGIVSVVFFACIFYQIQLYGLVLLQVFFLLANIYGWYAWCGGVSGKPLAVQWLSKNQKIAAFSIVVIASILLTFTIDRFFQSLTDITVAIINQFGQTISPIKVAPDAYPFWDALITVTSVMAQILMTRKFVENWFLWLLVNVVSIGVYIAQEVYVLALEYTLLLFIAANGARQWIALAQQSQISKQSSIKQHRQHY